MNFRHGCLVLAAAALFAAGCGDDDGGDDEATTDAESGTTSVAGPTVDTDTCGGLEYGGEREPQVLIVSDLPMQGDAATRSEQQVEAIRIELEDRDWKAGDLTVGYQACDDTIAKTGLWDEETCESNANAYVEQKAVLGVIGTYNSGCAAIEIPILNEGDVAMVSPGNTAVCLTEETPNCEDYDPSSLYPSGDRNYARVVPNDAFQGAALAQFASDEGAKSAFVLYAADDSTSTGQADNFRGAAEELGLEVAGFETWDPKAKDYEDLMNDVESSGADAVILAGLTDQNGGTLIEDKVEYVGPNDEVPLIAFDGFTSQATIDEAGDASKGMFASITGRAPEALSGAGQDLVAELEEKSGGDPVEQYAPYAAEAAVVLLDAIAEAGDDRAGVADAVLETKRDDSGLLGAYEFTETGDPSEGPVTIFEADGSFEVFDEVTPDTAAVTAARG